MKKYNIIYADPPWSYKSSMNGDRGVLNHYSVMSLEEIKKLPIKEIADKDCILFLWVTFPKINECFDVIKEWGFEYKTCAFVWVKKTKCGDKNFLGMGRWTRSNAEICLLATKGKPKRVSAAVRQIIESPFEKHSKKPAAIRERIVDLVGDLPRVELFARQKADGWDSWGNEVENDIELLEAN